MIRKPSSNLDVSLDFDPATHDTRAYREHLGLNPDCIPAHIGVIMDGNGRWAKERGWERIRGHQNAIGAVRATTTESRKLGVEEVTIYAFSTENWMRPRREVDALMELFVQYLDAETVTAQRNGIRLRIVGDRAPLQPRVATAIERAETATARGADMILNIGVNYGGRQEIVQAVRALAAQVADGVLDASAITADMLQRNLEVQRDVDLLIRTSGEQRISNFLPWQTTYCEYVFDPTLWPDFNASRLIAAVREYQHRARRFGSV